MSDPNKERYRLNVAAILKDSRDRILICERLGRKGSWQFPQGGVDPGETLEAALTRELYEEVGVTPEQAEIRSSAGPYRYDFEGAVIKGYHGKDQHFFLIRYHGPEDGIRLDMSSPEFQAYRWILPEDFNLDWLPPMKRPMYRQVFDDLLGVRI